MSDVIADRLPPSELRHAVDELLVGVSLRELRHAAEGLSLAYRSRGHVGRSASATWTSLDRLAYVATRMPATYRAAAAVLRELRARCPDLRIDSLLDIGSGPATSLWAGWSELDEMVRATLIEPDPAMSALAQRLVMGSSLAARVDATWLTRGVECLETVSAHDLVVAGYVLAELDDRQREVMVDGAWTACRGAVALIEPGSTAGFHRIIEARDRLIAHGATIVAPCPHARPCPLPPDDWCHFGVRLNRTAVQRRLKQAALAYEDEKFAYVIASRGTGSPAPARVIRRPSSVAGRVTLQLCGQGGLCEETVTRRRQDAYRQARKVRWGDSWDA